MRRAARTSPMALLLVEDHSDTRDAMAEWFRLNGALVYEARTVKQALEISRTKPFDILLCDVSLPDGTGWDLLARLKPKQPVVALAMSGLCAQSDLARSKAAGFFAHLVKPFGTEIQKTILAARRELTRRRGSADF